MESPGARGGREFLEQAESEHSTFGKPCELDMAGVWREGLAMDGGGTMARRAQGTAPQSLDAPGSEGSKDAKRGSDWLGGVAWEAGRQGRWAPMPREPEPGEGAWL